MKQWFAAKSSARHERHATTWLGFRDIETFLPMIPARKLAGRQGDALQLMFPGYFFARLDLDSDEWLQARSAPGVAYFLGAPGEPTALPDELIEGIRSRTMASRQQGWRPPFARNDRVLIDSGPFASLEAVFDRSLSASGRVRVLLQTISRLVPVELDVSVLRRAS